MARSKKAKAKIAGIEIDRMSLAEIVPAAYNPRTVSEESLAGLSRSVEEFGYVEPLIFNKRSGTLVSGHQRLKVLARQGVEEVDVVIVDLDEAQEKALNLTMNNQAIQGDWDHAALKDVLVGLQDHELTEGMFGGLCLDALLEGMGDLPDESSLNLDDEIKTAKEEVDATCPKCGFVFLKKGKADE